MAFVALTTVEHDGDTYKKGSVLPQLTEDQATALLEVGAIVEADATELVVHPTPSPEAVQVSPTGREQLAAAGQPITTDVAIPGQQPETVLTPEEQAAQAAAAEEARAAAEAQAKAAADANNAGAQG